MAQLSLLFIGLSAHAGTQVPDIETVVVCEASDPYRDLAERIADEEELTLVEDCGTALESHPRFMILVAIPARLTEKRLRQIGSLFQSREYFPGLGIISGSNEESAEGLWGRRQTAGNGGIFLAGDADKGQGLDEPAIYPLGDTDAATSILTKDTLINTLKEARYIYWARHVTENKWFWNSEDESFGEADKLLASEVPVTNALIVYTPSCGSFQPWVENSIALAFVDKGAAAYAGHVRTPASNNAFFLRHGLHTIGDLSWKDVPLGIIAQIQNRMILRASSVAPLFFMLGDPRIYVREAKPYELFSDELKGEQRIIQGRSELAGYLPVRISDGADYGYVKIQGLSSWSDRDLFHNSRLHALDLDTDKYVLFHHEGGDFTLELYRKAPFTHALFDPVLDAFDFSWVTIGVLNGPFSFLPLALFLAVFLRKILGEKRQIGKYRQVFLVSFLYSIAITLYIGLRVNSYTVNASIISWTVVDYILDFLGVFSCAACGLMILRDARGCISRATGFLVAIFPQLALCLFNLIFILFVNGAYKRSSEIGMPIWNYKPVGMLLSVLVFECALMVLFILIITRNRHSPEHRLFS